MTLVDYPGRVAATVFTRGCSFRCGFCHNPELVLPGGFNPEMTPDEIWDFLMKRRGKLEGVCLTGGEPLLFADTKDFMHKLKELGFLVKLDSNGSFPDRLREVIDLGVVDYIAMDIKSPLPRYAEVALAEGRRPKVKLLEKNIQESIKLIMDSGIDYEFRTTVVKPILSVGDFPAIGKMIGGARRYYIQNFTRSKHVDETVNWQPFSDAEIESIRSIMQQYVKAVGIR